MFIVCPTVERRCKINLFPKKTKNSILSNFQAVKLMGALLLSPNESSYNLGGCCLPSLVLRVQVRQEDISEGCQVNPSAAVMGKTECLCALEGGFIAVRSVNILLTSPLSSARLPLSSLHVVLICLCVRNCQKLDLCPVQLISMN